MLPGDSYSWGYRQGEENKKGAPILKPQWLPLGQQQVNLVLGREESLQQWWAQAGEQAMLDPDSEQSMCVLGRAHVLGAWQRRLPEKLEFSSKDRS